MGFAHSQRFVIAGMVLIAAAAFDLWRTFHRSARPHRLVAALVRSFVWAVFIVTGVAAIDYATTADTSIYTDHLLRATRAFAGSASVPSVPPEGVLLGFTRLAGRAYLIAVAFLIAAVLLQHRVSEKRTG